MKILGLLLLVLISGSCATLPTEQEAVQKWIGKLGYFTRPVEQNSPTQFGDYEEPSEFKACMLSKITDIKVVKEDNKLVSIALVVEQKGKTFLIDRINRLPIYSFKNSQYAIRSLDKYYVDNLDFRAGKVYMKELTKALPIRELVCAGIIWTKMKKEDFLFVKGRPNQIKVPSSDREQLEDWYYYYSKDKSENKRYRFFKSQLDYWKPINPDNKKPK